MILAQLKQKIITLVGDLPKLPRQKVAQVLGEKDPSTSREELMLNQRIILILFAATLLGEKLVFPLKGKLADVIRGLNEASSKHSIPLLNIAASILDEFPTNIEINTILRQFAPDVSEIHRTPQLITQDLLGKLYQEFNSRSLAKPLNMNFTGWESGFLLVGCATSLPNSTWGLLENLSKRSSDFTIIDPACGTGGLLLYSYLFLQEKISSTQAGAKHDRYIGLDVVPLAIHFLLASWHLFVDPKDVTHGNFQVLPLGAGRLGSLDFLDSSSQLYELPVMANQAQLVVMNPPFSRSSGSNTAFGTLPAAEQQSLGQRLKGLRKHLAYGNAGVAGLAADFMLLAHILLEPGGRLAAVLPISCLFGAAWTPVRRLLSEQYHVEVIFTHPEAGQCNFSDKTHLSECMLIARKHPKFQADDSTTVVSQIRHLSRKECTLSDVIKLIVEAYGQQNLEMLLERDDLAISAVDPANLSRFSWSWGPLFRFTNPKLNGFILHTFEWQALFFDSAEPCAIKLRYLDSLGAIAHDRAAYRARTSTSKSKIEGNYDLHFFPETPSQSVPDSLPAFWGRQNVTLTRWIVHPNALLVKRPNTTADQFTLHAASRAECLLPETLRFNTSALFALYCPEGVVSNVFWGFLPRADLKSRDGSPISTTEIAKITTLWANTTFGLLIFLAIADETDENLLHWKKQTLGHVLLPDPESLSRDQITQLCGLFDRYATEESHELLPQRICDQNNLPLDSDFFRNCLDPPDWEQFGTELIKNIKNLYHLGNNLFYIAR